MSCDPVQHAREPCIYPEGMLLNVIYYLESRDAPDSSDFASIATCIVWAAQALSGNFPYFPQSSAGKVVSAIMGFIGIGLYALPAG